MLRFAVPKKASTAASHVTAVGMHRTAVVSEAWSQPGRRYLASARPMPAHSAPRRLHDLPGLAWLPWLPKPQHPSFAQGRRWPMLAEVRLTSSQCVPVRPRYKHRGAAGASPNGCNTCRGKASADPPAAHAAEPWRRCTARLREWAKECELPSAPSGGGRRRCGTGPHCFEASIMPPTTWPARAPCPCGTPDVRTAAGGGALATAVRLLHGGPAAASTWKQRNWRRCAARADPAGSRPWPPSGWRAALSHGRGGLRGGPATACRNVGISFLFSPPARSPRGPGSYT